MYCHTFGKTRPFLRSCIVVVLCKNVFTTVFITHRDPRCILWWARTSSWYSFWQSSRPSEWRTAAATIIYYIPRPSQPTKIIKWKWLCTLRAGERERAADKNYGVKFAVGATVCRRFNFSKLFAHYPRLDFVDFFSIWSISRRNFLNSNVELLLSQLFSNSSAMLNDDNDGCYFGWCRLVAAGCHKHTMCTDMSKQFICSSSENEIRARSCSAAMYVCVCCVGVLFVVA